VHRSSRFVNRSADEEIISELTRELGFHRRGSRIVAALTVAIGEVKQASV
jgi:hypothetical protein